jgi:hypothetical protein
MAKIYKNSKGQCHRLDGPAVEHADGYTAWYVNGKFHRLDGAAVEYANGDKRWYVNGKYYGDNELTTEEFLNYMKVVKEYERV